MVIIFFFLLISSMYLIYHMVDKIYKIYYNTNDKLVGRIVSFRSAVLYSDVVYSMKIEYTYKDKVESIEINVGTGRFLRRIGESVGLMISKDGKEEIVINDIRQNMNYLFFLLGGLVMFIIGIKGVVGLNIPLHPWRSSLPPKKA